MKRILLLATGGTIATKPTAQGLVPQRSSRELLDCIPEIAALFWAEPLQLFNLDSTNRQPAHWIAIAQTIRDRYDQFDGFVISHGTDTMAYTASALTYMLQNLPIPVVLTGSQLPFSHPLTDATDNIRCAVAMALSGRPGVFLAFDRKVMLGCRGVKVRTSGFDAFESINWPYAARVTGSGLEICEEALPPAPRGPFSLEEGLCTKVFLLKLTPGLDPGIFDLLLAGEYQGILIEAFGAGGLHYLHRDLYEKLEALREKEIPVVVASQCLYEPSDLSRYEVGQLALAKGVISAQDMTSEGALTKLMWVLARTRGVENVRAWFRASMAAEIRP